MYKLIWKFSGFNSENHQHQHSLPVFFLWKPRNLLYSILLIVLYITALNTLAYPIVLLSQQTKFTRRSRIYSGDSCGFRVMRYSTFFRLRAFNLIYNWLKMKKWLFFSRKADLLSLLLRQTVDTLVLFSKHRNSNSTKI